MLPRTSFNSSPLVRCLAALQVAGPAEAPQTVAERLSHWLDWTDAIALAAALNAGPEATAVPVAPARTAAMAAAAAAQVDRVRHDLTRAISGDTLFSAAAPSDADFAPYRRQYLSHQRAMDARIGPLRAALREALSAQAGPLPRLAALDAVLEKALATRERHLLSGVPGWIEAHAAAEPAAWGATLQRVLRAELDTRLQPVDGLLEALTHPLAPPP